MGAQEDHLDDCLAAISAVGDEADTLFTSRRDAEARAEARALDAGEPGVAFHGQVLGIKACFDVAGWVTHCGSAVAADDPPATTDAAMVTLLRDGSLLLAQTNMTEFAYGALGLNPTYGTPTSPFFPVGERVSGGSTSGGAVAVAKHLIDIALGSDTSGSVRIPAAFCGVAGFKPSKGRYPEAGMAYLSPTFDTPGIINRTASGCRSVDRILTPSFDGTLRRAPDLPLDDLVIGVPRSNIEGHVDPTIGLAFESWLTALSSAGARIVDVSLPSLDDSTAATRDGSVISVEAFVLHRKRLARAADRYDPRVGARIAGGEHVPAHVYALGLQRLAAARNRFDAEVVAAGADLLLTPTVGMLPPRIADLADDADYLATNLRSFHFTEYANRLDLPSITIPGNLHDGQPHGLMITGHRADDVRLLDIAVSIERLLTVG
ncbi:MAG: amidase [Ilumatobacteraceae bacterium]|nr:amidase [Ilumatobacteraceae bacterium]